MKQIASPQPGMMAVAWWFCAACCQAFSRYVSVGMVARMRAVKSRVLWRLVEAASFRVVVCWFSACCGVMPPRERWGRRVLYQWTQAAVSRSTSRRSRHGRVAGARLVVDQFCFVQGVQRFGQGAIVGVTGRTHRLLPGNGRELARSARRGIGRLGRSGARAHECLYHRGDVGRSPCSTGVFNCLCIRLLFERIDA